MPASFDAASLSPIVERVGWTLVHFTWEGLVVAALLWMTLRAMQDRSAAARYGGTCLAMALLGALRGLPFFSVAAPPPSWVDTEELSRRALLAAEAGRVASPADASPLSAASPAR